ncbi:hypothetical protein [Mycolicibacterium rhodesiae]|uniref:Uncharacterized protein n=1 Tax=Mycolicibacterium rhodesiae TaxID=36814 RepID=A0A1X0J0J2_MYCRH|nr:hypothetical protein [Mycolicibacterium rhodesiae]MCV7345387.1 hypothetical protein [Mycolicibacterium rhodesiae]ORB54998.1 hypothetical protein BST42_09495 [Mycolicibacterium rhodesiae]
MTARLRDRADRRTNTAHRCGLAAAALGIGLGLGVLSGQAPAWADTGHADSSASSSSHSTATAARTSTGGHSAHREVSRSTAHSAAPRAGLATSRRSAVHTGSTAPQLTSTTPVTTSAATPPGQLSPIARLIGLPGHVVNTVLQSLDMTAATTGPQSPLNFAPIDQLVFAAFRRIEHVAGLDATPTNQPIPPTMTYTGSTTALTPTVAQFLNAAAAEYVLGGVPGGLRQFTVNGVPVTSTNVLSGESAQVWVTPQNQIIIAYQGTTGGTNLLFNPLIAISQIVTDLQILFTGTTPRAFTDALRFEQRVQGLATEQGYSTSDIFVTGHSLGGWEAEYVSQQTGLGGIGFESPGINTIVDGNGANSGFVNIETYGDPAAYFASDLPGLQPFMPAYVPGGGTKPHYGPIVMIGDPDAVAPLFNSSALYGYGPIGDAIFMIDTLGNFFEHHLPAMQAHNLDVAPDPTVVPWLGLPMGPVEDGYGTLTISQLLQAASLAGTLIRP